MQEIIQTVVIFVVGWALLHRRPAYTQWGWRKKDRHYGYINKEND